MSKMYKKITKDFVVVSNRIIRDPNLRLADKGLLTLLLSLPDGWNFSVKGLSAILPEGKDAISAGVQRLIEAGYVERMEQSRQDGRFSSSDWIIYDEPQTGTDKAMSPNTDFPATVDTMSDVPRAKKPAQYNKDTDNTDILNTDLSYTKTRQLKNIGQPTKSKCSFLLTESESHKNKASVRKNQFNSFSQRNYDYAALEREALGFSTHLTTDCPESTA